MSGLLSGEGKSWPETPKLIIPDDIYGSIVDVCHETARGSKIGTLRIGELVMQPYYPNTPELEAEYHDPESKYWKYIRDKLLGALQKSVGDKMNWYGMLRPVSVALEKGADGKYDRISCRIEYSGNGNPKTISATDLLESEARLEIELDTLMAGRTELYEYKVRMQSLQFKYIIENRKGEEQDRAWRLINLLALGSEDEQEYAREQLLNISYGYMTAKRNKKALIGSFEKAAEEKKISADVFQGYLTQAIDMERQFTENGLAEKIGCSASTISRIRSGEIQKPRKRRVLQIGVALGLNSSQLKQFVRSSGNSFPISKSDVMILDCLERGSKDYNEIMYEASKFDAKFDQD